MHKMSSSWSRLLRRYSAGVLAACCLATAGALPALAANPQPQADVLILGSSVDQSAGKSIEQQAAESVGLTVEVADDASWASKTASDFGGYKAIVLGDQENDPSCSSFTGQAPDPAAVANESVWGPSVTGNVILIGSDPAFHVQIDPTNTGAFQLIANGIQFASNSGAGKTGAYVSLSCYYGFAEPSTPVPLLNAFGPNQFAVTGDINAQCFNQAHIVAAHPALSGLTDASLSNWNCSVHEAFDQFSPAFMVLAVSLDDTNSLLAAGDPTSGSPFILARGFGVGATPELDSLLLFGSGIAGLAGYVRLRRRARRRRS